MEYKNYDTTLENVNQYLETYGVAVIPNILTEQECINYRTRIWEELKYVTQDRFDINDGLLIINPVKQLIEKPLWWEQSLNEK